MRDHQPQRSLQLLADMASAGLGRPPLLSLYNEAIAASAHACAPIRATRLLGDARVAGVESELAAFSVAQARPLGPNGCVWSLQNFNEVDHLAAAGLR